MTKPLLSIILPFFNEQKSIVFLLDAYKKFNGRYNFELICVNNGSTDDSERIFKTFLTKKQYRFVKYVKIEKNIGYGHGIMSGVKSAKGEVITWTHADMQTPVSDVFKAYEIYCKQENKKVFVKGSRTGRLLLDTFISTIMACMATVILRTPLYEINAQPKLFHSSFVKCLSNTPDDFLLDLFALYQAKKHKYIIRSFTVKFYKRRHGKSKWSYSFKSRFKMIMRTIKYIFYLLKIK